MIKNNKFYINNLKNVFFIGEDDNLEAFHEINKNKGINSFLVTSKHQSKLISKNHKYKVFDKLDNKFKNYVRENCNIKNTLFISFGSRFIFRQETIKRFFLNNIVNFHNSRLPYDAGGGDYSWRIIREDRIESQLVHLISDKIDGGPILDAKTTIFPSYCKVPIDYRNYSMKTFREFYESFVDKILKKKSFNIQIQSESLGRYNPRLNTNLNGYIDWNMDAHQLYNFINAFDDPFKGASTFLNNKKFGRLYIKKVHLHGGDSSNHPYMTGLISRHDKNWVVVSTTNKYMLLIEEVLNSKGENIITKLKPGDRFLTPIKYLEKGKKKISYFSKGLVK